MSSSVFSRLQVLFSKVAPPISSTTTPPLSSAANSATPFPPPSPKHPPPTSQNPLPSNIQEKVKKFKNNSSFLEFRNNHYHYEYRIRRLAAGKHYSAIEDIIEHQKQYNDSMSDELFGARLVKLYGEAGMFDHACKMFDELPKFNCPRTLISFNALLSACVDSKNLDKLGVFFRELPRELGIEPDVGSYNLAIKGFCESNDFDSAMKVIEKMEDSMIRPDRVSYVTVMEAYYRADNFEEAEKLWQRMTERGVIANVSTYNAKIRNMIRNDQVQEALELVAKMVKEEVNPDKYTYNAVIKGCVSNENLEQAKMVYRNMEGAGCCPDQLTYYLLIRFACKEGDIDFALELCKQAVKLKVYVHRSLMQLVVDALSKRTKTEEANELVELVKSSRKHNYTLTLPGTTL